MAADIHAWDVSTLRLLQVAGEYIVDSQVARPSKAALHQRSAMELWDISLTLTKAARSSLD